MQAHHKLYVEYHHRILAAIDKHIPVEEVMSIDEVACRLDRVQQEPAVAQKLAQNIKREIQSQVGECLTSSIGISANKLLAKIASNMQKPDGLVILPIEKLPGAILHLKIRAIPGIGPKMAERLQRAGITDIATLWNTDAARLRLIWGGVAGAKMHELLHGADIASPKTCALEHQPPARSGAGRQKHRRGCPDHEAIAGARSATPEGRWLLLPPPDRRGEMAGPRSGLLDGQAQLLGNARHRDAAACAAGHLATGARLEAPARRRCAHGSGCPRGASA